LSFRRENNSAQLRFDRGDFSGLEITTFETNDDRRFRISDCVAMAIATGIRAHDLREFADRLASVHEASIYHHFWGSMLRPTFDDPEFHNDFAAWAKHGIHDTTLAERLGAVSPVDFPTLHDLREELVEMVLQRLEESSLSQWSRAEVPFSFVRSQLVVIDTGICVENPECLVERIPQMSLNSVFYHLIDARRRTGEGIDDFRAWLKGFDGEYDGLTARIGLLDPMFKTLGQLRSELHAAFSACCERGGG
jgi:hypothetical protein